VALLLVGWSFGPGSAGEDKSKDKDLPRLKLQFHDKPMPRITAKGLMLAASMRFGLETQPVKKGEIPKLLTFHRAGLSNNTCVKIDGSERLFGSKPGKWKDRAVKLGKNPEGKDRLGLQSIWEYPDEKILVTQTVEVVRSVTSGLLDTALVVYEIQNNDSEPHQVGIRFLLDTQLGANDGAPFLLPGSKDPITTSRDFKGRAQVPEYLQVVEKANPDAPGTVAYLSLRLTGFEVPSRVTVCAWPIPALGHLDALGEMTRWEVPVFSMRALATPDKPDAADSAVVIYWDEQELKPRARRKVAFGYGLGRLGTTGGGGAVAGGGSDDIGVSVAGTMLPGTDFLVRALANNPKAGETLTLSLPTGLKLTRGEQTQKVPPLLKGALTKFSPVTWKVRANEAGRYTFEVQSSAGSMQTHAVTISKGKEQ
jgi:hypothetical protein